MAMPSIVRAFLAVVVISVTAMPSFAIHSTCYGTTANGRLENAVKLPVRGPNFGSYSWAGILLGRTYVHSKVETVVVLAYGALLKTAPDRFFVYGETGFKRGGQFKPHKTHQNGISVDFMVPVLNARGESVPLPTSVFNKAGYSIEFDGSGVYKGYRIDFEAMAAHLVALHKEARRAGIGIRRVIFDPALQPRLLKTSHDAYLRENIDFSKKPSWVRHDEHYHVDFDVKCQPM